MKGGFVMAVQRIYSSAIAAPLNEPIGTSWKLPSVSIAVFEAALVFALLAAVAALGGKANDWTGALAVFATFLHGQISFDLQESQHRMPVPDVQHYSWSGRLFVTKEILWIATFIMTGSWPLCAGSLIFATYPKWRAYLRGKLSDCPADRSH
jgi:hypothetical protein